MGVYRAGHKGMAWIDAPALGSASARLSFVPAQRGRHILPTIMAETNFPLGLFRAWTVWRPAATTLVYPRPEQPPQPLPMLQPTPGGAASAHQGSGSEFEGVRAYRRGDPLRLVVWKKVARSNELVSRDTSTSANLELWLDLQRSAATDLETQLSRLSAWVLAAERLSLNYGLRMPGLELPCAAGEAQRRTVLQTLACWPDGAFKR